MLGKLKKVVLKSKVWIMLELVWRRMLNNCLNSYLDIMYFRVLQTVFKQLPSMNWIIYSCNWFLVLRRDILVEKQEQLMSIVGSTAEDETRIETTRKLFPFLKSKSAQPEQLLGRMFALPLERIREYKQLLGRIASNNLPVIFIGIKKHFFIKNIWIYCDHMWLCTWSHEMYYFNHNLLKENNNKLITTIRVPISMSTT